MAMINGFNWHGIWGYQTDAIRKTILDSMAAAGLTSARLDFAWAQLEPNKGQYYWNTMDVRINEAAERGMTTLVMLYWPAAWASSTGVSAKNAPPKYPADFGNIIGQLGKRYGSKLAGVEMWNEPDLAPFWSGTRAQYFSMIAGAYPVAKNLAPNTTFIAAAPTYLGLASNWFRDAYATPTYKAGVSYDACAIHPYMSPSDLPPTAPKSNWSVLGIADVQALRASKGDTSPLWATEWGWSTHTQPAGTAVWSLGVTEAQQAAYIVDQTKMMPALGVTHSYIYTDANTPTAQTPGTGIHEHNFGMLRDDYTGKPVMAALTEVLKTKPTPPEPEPEPVPPSDDLAALHDEIDALHAEVAALTTDHDTLALKVDGMSNAIIDLSGAIGDLESRQHSSEQEIAAVQRSLSGFAVDLQAAADGLANPSA